MYDIIVDDSFKILCDCTVGCKKCGRDFGGIGLPDEVKIYMTSLKEELDKIKNITDSVGDIEKIKPAIDEAILLYEKSNNRLRHPPKYRLVKIEEE